MAASFIHRVYGNFGWSEVNSFNDDLTKFCDKNLGLNPASQFFDSAFTPEWRAICKLFHRP
jgi:hypothetical protein